MSFFRDQRLWLCITIGLLIGQIVLLWLSMDALPSISIFCTVARSSWPGALGHFHFLYPALFIFGVAALFWPRGRPIYAALACLSLLALPLQAQMVRDGQLSCDAP